MRTLNLAETRPSIEQILDWAQEETVLIRTTTGADFVVASVEDLEYERELESLRNNEEFIAFLDARAKEPTVSLEEARKTLLGPDV